MDLPRTITILSLVGIGLGISIEVFEVSYSFVLTLMPLASLYAGYRAHKSQRKEDWGFVILGWIIIITVNGIWLYYDLIRMTQEQMYSFILLLFAPVISFFAMSVSLYKDKLIKLIVRLCVLEEVLLITYFFLI